MKLVPHEISAGKVYATMTMAITPRPIAWVSTISDNGVPNLAPFSYFNAVCSQPAALMFSAVNKSDGSPKDTIRNIRANGQFVVNVVPHSMAAAMGQTATELPYESSEFELAELDTIDSDEIRPPRVVGSPVQFECERIQIIPLGEGPTAASVVLGKILLMHIDDKILDGDQKIDPELLDTVGRLGGKDYCRTTDRFTL